MDRIDSRVSATDPATFSISGAALSNAGSRHHDRTCTVQISPDADGAFEVHLEGAVSGAGGTAAWQTIGKWTDGDETLISVVPISEGVQYRFRHESGVACRVFLTP